MLSVDRLLEIQHSKLSWLLRMNLLGLETQLREALREADTDPGKLSCQELLDQLEHLLNSESDDVAHEYSPFESSSLPVEPSNPKKIKLQPICDRLLDDPEILACISSEYSFTSLNDPDLWHEIQHLLLRVPENLARVWRKRILTFVSDLGAKESNKQVSSIPSPKDNGNGRDTVIYSGLSGELSTQGLRLSKSVKFDERLYWPRKENGLDFFAGMVSLYLKFIDKLDTSHLCHALKSIDPLDIKPLSKGLNKDKYIDALITRFQRVQETFDDADPITALQARLDLDEAFHSLVYTPPVDRFSWWGRLQQDARRTLDEAVVQARAAGHQVQIRPLWGTYADIFRYSKDDLPLDIGGEPHKVSACLRVYAKIDNEELPGRVLYRRAVK